MKFLITNTYSWLKTDHSKLIKVLVQKYMRKVPRSKWPVQFVTPAGRFGTGLLPYIMEDLERVGIKYEVEDTRDLFKVGDSCVDGLTLRDYQSRFVKKALDKRRCIIKAPTASGKTPMMAELLMAMSGRKGVIFFTKKSLVTQTYEFLHELGFDVGICFGEGYILKDVMLCTVQSISKIVDTHLDAEFIMFDEVHEFPNGKVSKAVLSSFKDASIRIGMTATVQREDIPRMTLTAFLGDVIEETSVNELVEQGWLTPPRITMFDIPDTSTMDDAIGRGKLSYIEFYEKYVVNCPIRNNAIKSIVEDAHKLDSSKTLVLVKNIAHAELLNEMIPNSVIIQGRDSLAERNKAVKDFIKSSHGVIIGTVVFQTGINIPEITHFVNARGLKSEIATIQAMGRALRLHESKHEVYIFDFLDNIPYMGKHSKSRLRSYKGLGQKVHIDEKRFGKIKQG